MLRILSSVHTQAIDHYSAVPVVAGPSTSDTKVSVCRCLICSLVLCYWDDRKDKLNSGYKIAGPC